MRHLTSAAIACAILLSGCAEGMTAPTPALTDQQAAAVAGETVPLAYAMLVVFQRHGVAPPIFVMGPEGAPAAVDSAITGCHPVLSGALASDGTPLDSDGDGIADSLVATYSAATCAILDPIDGSTESFSGTLHFQDLPGLYAFRWSADFIDRTERGTDFAERHTEATESASLFADHGEAMADIRLSMSFHHDSVGGTSRSHAQWSATFLPDSGALIASNALLPSGEISFSGTYEVGEPLRGVTGTFTIGTTVPIHYSAACDAAFSYPAFTGGVIAGSQLGGSAATFTATFAGCHRSPVLAGHGGTP